MVSQVPYAHVANKYVRGRRPFAHLLIILLCIFLLIIGFYYMIFLAFNGYVLHGLAVAMLHRLRLLHTALADRDVLLEIGEDNVADRAERGVEFSRENRLAFQRRRLVAGQTARRTIEQRAAGAHRLRESRELRLDVLIDEPNVVG